MVHSNSDLYWDSTEGHQSCRHRLGWDIDDLVLIDSCSTSLEEKRLNKIPEMSPKIHLIRSNSQLWTLDDLCSCIAGLLFENNACDVLKQILCYLSSKGSWNSRIFFFLYCIHSFWWWCYGREAISFFSCIMIRRAVQREEVFLECLFVTFSVVQEN